MRIHLRDDAEVDVVQEVEVLCEAKAWRQVSLAALTSAIRPRLSDSRRGISTRNEPSLCSCEKSCGRSLPSLPFVIKTTGLMMPGTAALAMTAE